MAKIAVNSEPPVGSPGTALEGRPESRTLAQGDGWCVSDVLCCAGPKDRPFEEQHSDVCIAIVIAGSFQYRSEAGRELMTPGSLLLGSPGQYFECGHEHGVGDRCLSFSYTQCHFEEIAEDAKILLRKTRFSALRVPPVREFSSLVALASAELRGAKSSHSRAESWEELAIELAGKVLGIEKDFLPNRESSPAAESRVTQIVRRMESHYESEQSLVDLAREAKLSRYHFLRLFRHLTGLTPHQYLRRARLRDAATRLMLEPARVLDIALDSGFGDVSNFNHAFRAEFGCNPLSFRNLTSTGNERS